jgi:hypothetical protein
VEILLYFLIAGFVMSLFSVPVIALYSALEKAEREKEIKRFVHKQLIEKLRIEAEQEERNKRITL